MFCQQPTCELLKKAPLTGGKPWLLMLLTFETGYEEDFELVGPFRYWPYFVAMMRFASYIRGSRSARRGLRENYNEDGLCSILYQNQQVHIKHNYTDEVFLVADSSLPRWTKFEDLFLCGNHSESKVRLRSKADLANPGFRIATLITDHCVVKDRTPPPVPAEARAPPKKQLALRCVGSQLALPSPAASGEVSHGGVSASTLPALADALDDATGGRKRRRSTSACRNVPRSHVDDSEVDDEGGDEETGELDEERCEQGSKGADQPELEVLVATTVTNDVDDVPPPPLNNEDVEPDA